ncbi:MAG: type II toxin-antitoxin system Phd/YefM family antitoxin [Chthoniobacterales bacterium]
MKTVPTIETATAADLRNQFRRVSAWIDNGQVVNITRRGVLLAQLTPPPTPEKNHSRCLILEHKQKNIGVITES